MDSHLPVELHIQCLVQLPGREPSSLQTVVSFLSANSVTRAAALDKPVWESLYRSRYTHNVPEREEERLTRYAGDWQMIFIERYKLDRAALELVDCIRMHPEERDVASHRLVLEFSWDVWDALELETQVPIPHAFRDPAGESAPYQEPAPHALPRRFWATASLGAMARYHAVKNWARILKRDEGCTFEDVLTGLSAFMDISPYHISKQLDDLANQCRQRLTTAGMNLVYADPGCELLKIAVAVRDFLHDEGFAVASDGMAFYNPFNQFPHYFLTVGRSSTLPISINYVYSAICRRLGITALPTNTPRKVLCHIASNDPEQGDILVDPCAKTQPIVFSSRDLSVMLHEADMHPSFSRDAVMPAEFSTMVDRAVRNAFATMRDVSHVDPVSGYTIDRVQYGVSAAFATINAPGVQITPMVTEDCSLDNQVVLVDALLPVVPPARREMFMAELALYTASRLKYKIEPPRRRRSLGTSAGTVRWFVGQVLSHPEDGEACVIGWTVVPGFAMPGDTDVTWTTTYQVLTKEGIVDVHNHSDHAGGRWASVAVTSTKLRWLRKHIYMFERFFEDAHVPRDDGVGGRLIPTLELQQQYPDDLEAGVHWTEHNLPMPCVL
ncbi:Transglutaminase-like superfamily-domain-containing protein [Ganoderma leucocontextum]|nr:Transglutaminase-like superfamily-domain-containing protein [Ganoderma leucocontextum]